MNIYQGI